MLLHIDSSADTTADSVTRQLTDTFARTWHASHGSTADHRHRDLSAAPVPPITPPTPPSAAAWNARDSSRPPRSPH